MEAVNVEDAFQNVASPTLVHLTAGNDSDAFQGLVITQTDVVDPGQGHVPQQAYKVLLGLGNEQRNGSSPFQQQTANLSNAGGVKFANELQKCVINTVVPRISTFIVFCI
jgi:hypothetical protein